MNREEILAKAKNESCDEMELRIRDQSMRWTYITMVFVAAIFAFIRGQRNEPMMDLCATVCASVVAGQLYRYFKIKERWCLVMGLIALSIGIFAVIRFFMGH